MPIWSGFVNHPNWAWLKDDQTGSMGPDTMIIILISCLRHQPRNFVDFIIMGIINKKPALYTNLPRIISTKSITKGGYWCGNSNQFKYSHPHTLACIKIDFLMKTFISSPYLAKDTVCYQSHSFGRKLQWEMVPKEIIICDFCAWHDSGLAYIIQHNYRVS